MRSCRTSHRKAKFLHNFHFDDDVCLTRYILATKKRKKWEHVPCINATGPAKQIYFILPRRLMCFLHVSRLISPTTTTRNENKKNRLGVCCDARTPPERNKITKQKIQYLLEHARRIIHSWKRNCCTKINLTNRLIFNENILVVQSTYPPTVYTNMYTTITPHPPTTRNTIRRTGFG